MFDMFDLEPACIEHLAKAIEALQEADKCTRHSHISDQIHMAGDHVRKAIVMLANFEEYKEENCDQ